MEPYKTEDIQVELPIGDDVKNEDILKVEAKEAQASEHALSVAAAIRAYPMAIFWSLMVSMCVVMEGYDTIL